MWRDIKITFTRNLPENTLETAQMVNQLRGLVSDETLLSQIPFITNPAEEVERVKEQKQLNVDLYSFPTGNEEEE
nr:MAG TPA: portal protein [Caudoviricetes sp.]